MKGDRLPYTHTPGRDVSGIVETCGSQVTRFRPGDALFGMVPVFGGGYAEQVVLDELAAADTPAGLDHVRAAAIPPAGQTAYQGQFRRGKLKAGETVLIHAGSRGGHFAIQLAKAIGARGLTTLSTEHIDYARSLEAEVVIDHKT